MTKFLVGTASRGTTAAACDYLDDRLESGDEVYVLTVEKGDDSTEAGFDLARARLGGVATVRTIRQTGEPARVIVMFARDREVDEIVIGPRSGPLETDPSALGSTARGILRETDKPVFVLGR